jgi:AP-2 complex subunit sigma-1
LFFTLCVDVNDNELLYFESIHLFVELLDQFFGNVCELDLVFNFNKVYMILDEFFLAGEVQETSKQGNRAARIALAILCPRAPHDPFRAAD